LEVPLLLSKYRGNAGVVTIAVVAAVAAASVLLPLHFFSEFEIALLFVGAAAPV